MRFYFAFLVLYSDFNIVEIEINNKILRLRQDLCSVGEFV